MGVYYIFTCTNEPSGRRDCRKRGSVISEDQTRPSLRGPNENFPQRMNADTFSAVAYSLSVGSLESMDDAPLHSTLLHQASAARLLVDHVDPRLPSFPALDALTRLDLPEETTSDMEERALEEAIESVAQDVERVASLSLVAFELSALPALHNLISSFSRDRSSCFRTSPPCELNLNDYTQSGHA